MELWNNPSCTKCAAARDTLDAARVPYRLRAYLEQRPTVAELTEVLHRLGAEPWDICRLQEPEAVARGMAEWPRDENSVPRWLEAMVAAPQLIQRPILLLDDGSAMVARTPQALDSAISQARAEPAG
jgi:arsenate reductase (glutaredoxin)